MHCRARFQHPDASRGAELQTQVFSADNTTAGALTYDTTGPVPFYAVTFSPGSFLDPATATTDSYSYGASDNRLASIAEASGHTRSFTCDATVKSAHKTKLMVWIPHPFRR